jgi:hypothetical protein
MKPRRTIPLLLALLLLTGCAEKRPATETGPDPLVTVESLLKLHDVWRRQPEERSSAARRRPVDEDALKGLVYDYGKMDPFFANLYVGFVVGALARYQTRLGVTVRGDRAEVQAGALQVVMRRVDRSWRVDLARTVPEQIKARARAEKRRLAGASSPG